MKRRMRSIAVRTADELRGFLAALGLSVGIRPDPGRPRWAQLRVFKGEWRNVVKCERWDRRDFDEPLAFRCRLPCRIDEFVPSIATSIASKRFMTWSETSAVTAPFGTRTTKTVTRLDVPDFSSLSELRLKLAAEGDWT